MLQGRELVTKAPGVVGLDRQKGEALEPAPEVRDLPLRFNEAIS